MVGQEGQGPSDRKVKNQGHETAEGWPKVVKDVGGLLSKDDDDGEEEADEREVSEDWQKLVFCASSTQQPECSKASRQSCSQGYAKVLPSPFTFRKSIQSLVLQ